MSAIACLSLAISLNGPTRSIKQAGTAMALISGGAAVATALQNNRIDKACRIQSASQFAARQQLQASLKAAYEEREASLQTFLDMSMTEAERLKAQIARMHKVLADDQLEKISLLSEIEAFEDEYQCLLYDLRESVLAEADTVAQTAHIQSTSKAEANQVRLAAQERITQLETALAQKTDMATQMLSELESEAQSTFEQFNAKVNAQGETIETLHQQIDALKAENAVLTRKQIDKTMGSIGKSERVGSSLFGRQAIGHPG